MKRLSLLGFAGVLAALLGGCPIYDEEDPIPCSSVNCGSGTPVDGCDDPSDCGQNETCGDDGQCHSGDCTLWGCVEGFDCVVDSEDLTASCQPGGAGGSGGGSGGSGGGSGGSDAIWCGKPGDCATGETCAPDGTCQHGACNVDLGGGTTLGCIYGFVCDDSTGACLRENPAGCGTDFECAGFGEGYLCLSGLCTAPPDQCFDQTQCRAGDRCVDGKCTVACDVDGLCSSTNSYTCDATYDLCTVAAQGCVITNDCGGPDAVCVDGACVPRSDGPTCPDSTRWVDNGCIPDQLPNFICGADGAQDACAPGSLCLHHSCYISCGPPNQTACDNQPPALNQCKTVTTISGTHDVCGSNQNLGDECAPDAASCSVGGVCIDGFCN